MTPAPPLRQIRSATPISARPITLPMPGTGSTQGTDSRINREPMECGASVSGPVPVTMSGPRGAVSPGVRMSS